MSTIPPSWPEMHSFMPNGKPDPPCPCPRHRCGGISEWSPDCEVHTGAGNPLRMIKLASRCCPDDGA